MMPSIGFSQICASYGHLGNGATLSKMAACAVRSILRRSFLTHKTVPNAIIPWSTSNLTNYQQEASRMLHTSNKWKQVFNFIEYDSGPCTADKIVTQADKYGSSLVECVSSDFEMDKGLAKCFQKSFQHRELLKQQAVKPGNAVIIPYKDCYIYYLVTRERWWDRGCYTYLRSALNDVKNHCKDKNVKELCMGRLGSGIDGLDWEHVREIVKETFGSVDVTVKAQITR